MIIIKEYRGHIRNWESLCAELQIDASLTREKREKENSSTILKEMTEESISSKME